MAQCAAPLCRGLLRAGRSTIGPGNSEAPAEMRYALFLVGLCSCGATLNLTATCTDALTVNTATSASCNAPRAGAEAMCGSAPTPYLQGQYSVFARATFTFDGVNVRARADAIAQFEGDFN